MKISQKKIKQFQQHIFTWYAVNKRDLPWRHTRNPYYIFLSEVMSQQTQINRVIPKYEAWIIAFPSLNDMAKAPVSEILRYWSGLGYNRRALNLKKTAEIIVNRYQGTFPRDEKSLVSLPGIGLYTARAIRCFAFNHQIAVVDTNVRKIILTQFASCDIRENEIHGVADLLLPHGKAYDWNQALMDYAGAVLRKEKIPVPKQSTFIGSHRYYRGRILKVLLEKKKISINEIGVLLKSDYTNADKKWLQGLIWELKNEGFIIFLEGVVSLPSS